MSISTQPFELVGFDLVGFSLPNSPRVKGAGHSHSSLHFYENLATWKCIGIPQKRLFETPVISGAFHEALRTSSRIGAWDTLRDHNSRALEENRQYYSVLVHDTFLRFLPGLQLITDEGEGNRQPLLHLRYWIRPIHTPYQQLSINIGTVKKARNSN